VSIDATIERLVYNEDGTAEIHLIDRGPLGCAGQPKLVITNPPPSPGLDWCVGKDIWGGCGTIYMKSQPWADREGYTKITLQDPGLVF
jgi:hypothetical protein